MSEATETRVPRRPKHIVWLETTLGVAAAAILFAMMVITVVDVVGRYLFDAPLPAGYELIQFGMASLVFLILPVVTARGENVTVELIPMKRGPRLAAVLDATAALISTAVLIGFGIELWRRAGSFGGETSSNMRMPLAPFAYGMSVVWFLCAGITAALGILGPRAPQSTGGKSDMPSLPADPS
jgi:TRAP-type C4-dicarboxylate transport system permease small subunit